MIIPMKKARIVVLKDDQKRLLKSLQNHHVIMPIDASDGKNLPASNPDIMRTENSLKLLKKYQGKQKFFVEPNNVSYEEFIKINPEHENLVIEIENAFSEIARLKGEIVSLESEINALLPFSSLEINLKERKNLKYANLYTGFIPNRNLDALKESLSVKGVIVNDYGNSPNGNERENKQRYNQQVKSFGGKGNRA